MSNTAPYLKLLTDQQTADLHAYSVKILKTYGMRVEDPEVRRMLAENGCVEKDGRVLFCDELIERMLQAQQQHVTLTSPVTGIRKEMAIGRCLSHSTGGAPWIADMKTGKRSNATQEDLIATIRIMNQLDNLDIPCALVYPSDVPSPITQLQQTVTMFEYSHKPIYGPGLSLAENAKYVAELFKIYSGDSNLQENPIGMVGISPEAPLFLPKHITDTTRYIAEAGIPISILSAPMGGLTGPLSVAGTVAQCHAEILAYACVAFLFNPACVLIRGSRTFFANMKNTQSILGLPETGISSAISAQLGNYCGMMSDVYGISCTSCAMDEQAGYEKMMGGLLPALAGASLITGFGSTASVMCASLSQLVLDDEIVGMIKKSLRPHQIDEEELGFEAIGCVVNDHETFMEQEHTIEHLYNEIFTPSIGFDSVWAEWISTGEVPLTERAQERAVELLAKDEVIPVRPEIRTEVDRLMESARRELL